MAVPREQTELRDVALHTQRVGHRFAGLDVTRGIAIMLMVLDHGLVVAGQDHSPIRMTMTRAALPVFMVLAGALIGAHLRGRRLLRVAIAGLALPLVVPWIDNPNILVLYVLGAVIVWAARGTGRDPRTGALWVALVAVVTLSANGWGDQPGGYPWAPVVALMLTGALAGRWRLAAATACLDRRWLRPVQWIGRYPLTVYVGHLLILQLVVSRL